MDEISIPYTTKGNLEYLIRFLQFEQEHLPQGVNVPVFDISIITMADSNFIKSTSTTLFEIGAIIRTQADKEDAVYYCICSDKHINKSPRKAHLSHQQYRSNLFSAMFNKANKDNAYTNKTVVIDDPQQNNHYIHLISLEKNIENINLIAETLKGFDK